MRIAVISDTHGRLRAETAEQLKGMDCIMHAGDLDDPGIFQELDRIAPVYGVRGNNDWGGWAQELPRLMRIDLGGIAFCITHKRADVPRNLTGVDVVICGHTHQYAEEWIQGRLWLNPGSCGWPRFGNGLTMALLYIEDQGLRVEQVTLEP